MKPRHIRLMKGRKAVLFSLISVLFSVLFITIFSQDHSSVYEDKIPASNLRIKAMDVYTRNFETYVSSSIKVSTYRTLEGMAENLSIDGGLLFPDYTRFNNVFMACMICDDANCSSPGTYPCDLGSYTLKARLDNISRLSSQQLNINTSYTINSINITQEYPFEVRVYVNITYNVTDDSGSNYYARWSKNKVIVEDISIIGLPEPLSYQYGGGVYTPHISESLICKGDETCWNDVTTTAFYNSNNYRYTTYAPSYLSRFWYSTDPSDCCGIETIIHPTAVALNDHISFIDYQYWLEPAFASCTSGGKIVNVTIAGDVISLDEASAVRYGISNQSKWICN